jgi:electron transfer flavoprotein alpha/beta subunit
VGKRKEEALVFTQNVAVIDEISHLPNMVSSHLSVLSLAAMANVVIREKHKVTAFRLSTVNLT